MKRFLLSFVLFSSIAWANSLNAQCSIAQSSVSVSEIVTASTPNGCEVTFTLEFDLAGNDGNKWSHIHIWDASNYPNPAINWPSKPSVDLDLLTQGGIRSLLATISLDYSKSDVITVASSFPADNTVPVVYGGVIATKSPNGALQHFKISGIKILLPACGSAVDLKADVWSAQDQNGKVVACGVAGLSFTANDPIIRATNLGCEGTRQVVATFITTEERDITFNIYKDVEPYNVFTAADILPVNKVGGEYYVTTEPDLINGGYRFTGAYNYSVNNGERFNVWIVAETPGILNMATEFVSNSCAALPVSFRSFTAARNKNSVALKWETASEQNNRGFYIQRNTQGVWENIAFVFSAAEGGNSSSLQTYNYKDLNTNKGISQYRIQQVDLDGKIKFSDIRSVRGEEQSSNTIVYPNPSQDGRVNVVFEDQGMKNVVVSDMSGRIIRKYQSVVNTLQVENLETGVYTIQITDLSSAAITTEKVLIKRR